MHTVYLQDLFREIPSNNIGDARITGWVRTIRDSKEYGFIEINDGTHFKNLQIVVEKDTTQDFASVVKIPTGSAIEAIGELVVTPGAQQPFELKAREVTVVGESDDKYPLQKKRHSFEFLRTIAHLRPRTNTFYAVFSIRSKLAQSIHAFFAERNFNYVHTPIITTSDAEGAGEMFQVTTLDLANVPKLPGGEVDFSKDFFDKKVSLSVSGQLNVEAFCMAFRNVYTFGPTFRSENSNTPRHAAEFWMIEPEIAFADLFDDMQLAQDMLQYIIKDILVKAPEELAFLDKFVEKGLIEKLEKLRDAQFARMTYTEAIEILEKSGRDFQFKPYWGCDIQTEHERYLSEEHIGGPVFVYNYPKDIKSFYMRLNDDGKTVAATDMLVPGIGELIGGSQREERMDVLKKRMDELELSEEEYGWYLDLRRWGGTPHAGFGIGFERLVMYVTGMSNIRDVLPYPRCVHHAEF